MTVGSGILAEAFELSEKSVKFLTPLEKQRRFLVEVYSIAKPCPYCEHKFNVWEAGDENWSWDSKSEYHCPNCGERVRYMVPLVSTTGPYFWGKYLDKWPGAVGRKVINEGLG